MAILYICSMNTFEISDGYSFAFNELNEIPLEIATCSRAPTCKRVDLTETGIRDLDHLKYFTSIETLVLDKNELRGLQNCPPLPSLETLWFNNNLMDDLTVFMDEVTEKCPNIKYLSVMRNPACAGVDFLSSGVDSEAIRLYRLYILYRTPKLVMIDWVKVSAEERAEAKIRGQYAATRKPVSVSVSTSTSAPAPASHLPVDSSDVRSSEKSGTSESPVAGSEDASETTAGAAAVLKPRGPAFKGVVAGFSAGERKPVSRNSEGNRFIVNSQL